MISGFRISIPRIVMENEERANEMSFAEMCIVGINSFFSTGNLTYGEICQNMDITTIISSTEFDRLKFLKSAHPQCSTWLINEEFGYNEKIALDNIQSELLSSDMMISKDLINQIQRETEANAVYNLSQQLETVSDTFVAYTKLTLKRSSDGFDQEEVLRLLDSVKYSMSKISVKEMLAFLKYVYEKGVSGVFVIVDKQTLYSSSHQKITRKHFNVFKVKRVNEELFEVYFDLKFENCSFSITHDNQGAVYNLISAGGSSDRLLFNSIGLRESFQDEHTQARNRKERRRFEKQKK